MHRTLTTGRPFVIWARGQPPDEEALGLTIKEKFTVEQPYRPPISRLCALKTIDIESCQELIIFEKWPMCARRVLAPRVTVVARVLFALSS